MTTETTTDMITAEEAEKLLDGTTPGPWRAEGDPWSRIVWSSAENRVCFMAHSNGLDDARDVATSNLVAAAPDLARTVIALHAQLADAKAAQAMVVERAVGVAKRHRSKVQINEPLWHDGQDWASDRIAEAIEALADTDGMALVQALRAERDELKQKLISPDPYEDTAHFDDHSVNRFAAVMKGKLASKRLQGRGGWQAPEVPNGYLSRLLREHVDKGDPVDVANFAMMIHQRGERIAPENEGASCKAIDKAEADRDRLAAANAALEAQVGALTKERDEAVELAEERLRGQHRLSNQLNDTARELNARLAAALATQEAGTC